MSTSRSLPTDGTPLCPAPALAAWREEAPVTPLRYPDGHDGLIATRYDAARAILQDPRFSQLPSRMPGSTADREAERRAEAADPDADPPDYSATNLLALDGPQHVAARRAITGRFSVRSARAGVPAIAALVRSALDDLRAAGSPADLTAVFAEPLSAANHCRVLGIPDALAPEFTRRFVHASSRRQKIEFIRQAIAAK